MAVEQNADGLYIAIANGEHHQLIRLGFHLEPFPHRAYTGENRRTGKRLHEIAAGFKIQRVAMPGSIGCAFRGEGTCWQAELPARLEMPFQPRHWAWRGCV